MPKLFELRFWGGFSKQKKLCLAENKFSTGKLDLEMTRELHFANHFSAESQGHKLAADTWTSMFFLNKKYLIQAAVLSFFGSLALLFSIFCTEKLLIGNSNLHLLGLLCIGFLVFQLISLVCTYYSDLIKFQIQSLTHLSLINIINRKLLSIDPQYKLNFSSGNLKTLTSSDVDSVGEFLNQFISQGVPFLVSTIVLLPYIILATGVSGLLAVLVAVIQIPISMLTGKLIFKIRDKSQLKRDNVTTATGEWIRNMRLIRTLSLQQIFKNEIGTNMLILVKYVSWEHAITCLIFGLSFCWWMAPIAVLIMSAQYLNSEVSLASLFSSVWLLNHLSNSIKMIPYSITCFATAKAGLNRIQKFISAPDVKFLEQLHVEEIDFSNRLQKQKMQISKIHFSNVCLTINGTIIFQNLNVSFAWHERTGIIGSVSSGKTSLLRLLTGELAPSSGSINLEFSNGEIRNLWLENVYYNFRNQIAYVPQEPFLSNASFASNISLDEEALNENLMKAAAAAELEADIALLELGYEQEIGEAGINLSGGQKQRVSLARALYSERKFILLDDPLSAVDSHTEKKLMDTFLNSNNGFILVSHRLTELCNVDRLIALENGKIVEDSTPALLLANPNSRWNELLLK